MEISVRFNMRINVLLCTITNSFSKLMSNTGTGNIVS